MSGKPSRLELAAAAAAASREQEAEGRKGSAGGGKVPSTGDRPIRTTVDLSPVHHRWLGRFTAQTQLDLGLAKLYQSQVWRALLDELDADPALRKKVVDRIRLQS